MRSGNTSRQIDNIRRIDSKRGSLTLGKIRGPEVSLQLLRHFVFLKAGNYSHLKGEGE